MDWWRWKFTYQNTWRTVQRKRRNERRYFIVTKRIIFSFWWSIGLYKRIPKQFRGKGVTTKAEDKNYKTIPTPEPEDNFIIGLNFKNSKKNKKLRQAEKRKPETAPKKETIISNNIEPETKQEEIKNNTIEIESQPIKEEKREEASKPEVEKKEEIKKEKKTKVKKIKKEKRSDKEATDDFIEQMRKREKERQEQRKLEEEEKKKEQEEKEREEQQRLLEEEQRRKEQEEKLRQEEELKKELIIN